MPGREPRRTMRPHPSEGTTDGRTRGDPVRRAGPLGARDAEAAPSADARRLGGLRGIDLGGRRDRAGRGARVDGRGVRGRRVPRVAQRGAPASARGAAAAVHAPGRLPGRAVRGRLRAPARARGVPRRHPRRLVRRRAARRDRDLRGEPDPPGDPRHQRRRRVQPARDAPDRAPPGRERGHRRARHRVPRDRRARAPGAARRDARRQRAEHGALDRGGRLSAL